MGDAVELHAIFSVRDRLGHPAVCQVTDFLDSLLSMILTDMCSAYPSLVQSLLAMFEKNGVREFVMAWNRRISESFNFFVMMQQAGFLCHHHGKCVYSFYRPAAERAPDSCLDDLVQYTPHT